MDTFSLNGSCNKPILIDLHLTNNNKSPLVIFCHGFKGFKDWGPFNYMANRFVKEDISFLKFNFSHNGVTEEDLMNFTDLDAFSENNFSKELEDLDIVVKWIANNYQEKLDTNNIYLMGHSRGGGISILYTMMNPIIKRLVSWASVCDFKSRFVSDKLNLWKEKGLVYVFNSRTNQQMPLNYQFYEDFIANEKKLTISKAANSLTIPSLIVHGDTDLTVDVSEAINLNEWIKNSELIIIKDADHVFNSGHPFVVKDKSAQLEKALNSSISFFKKMI
jgi:pimeloyl-ACP methyl ester carboxylesterase